MPKCQAYLGICLSPWAADRERRAGPMSAYSYWPSRSIDGYLHLADCQIPVQRNERFRMPLFDIASRRISRKFAGILFALFAAIAVTACAPTRGGSIPYGIENFGEPDAPSATTLTEDYRIAPLDTVSVNIFQVKDLSGQYKVDLTGNIAMPLLGNVRVVDMTTAELSSHLEAVLGKSYLTNPNVAVGITESAGSKVTVEGSVKRPGIYPVYGKMSLLQAVAMASGADDYANPKRVAIFRQIDGQRMAAAFDLTTIRAGEDPDPAIYRGDIIVVDGSKIKRDFQDLVRSMPIFSVFGPVAY